MAQKQFTREQIYELAWQTPMAQLAKLFGISDVGLAKLLRKHDIPLPPRGYWARLEAGQSPRKPTLLPVAEAECIYLNELSEAELAKRDEVAQRIQARPAIEISIAESLRGAHPLISAARQELMTAKVNRLGMLEITEKRTLNISVSKAQLSRALRIVDAVFKYAIVHAYEVFAGPEIGVAGERVPFGVKEFLTEIKEQSSEPDLGDRYEFQHSRFQTRQEPSGKLSIFLEVNPYDTPGLRKHWSDTDSRSVEDYLGKFFEGVLRAATMLRERKEETQRQKTAAMEAEKQRQIQAKHWAELRQLQAQEKAKLDALLKQIEGRRLAQEIRELVQEYRASVLSTPDARVSTEWLDNWSRWALLHADRFDPLTPSPPSILDQQIPEETRRW